jgi:hypothetical protein
MRKTFISCATLLNQLILFSFLDEVIGIDLLDLIGCHCRDADVVFDHEFGKAAAVYENDFAVDVLDVLGGILAKLRGRDEDPFPSPLPLQSPGKFLDLGSSYGTVPTLSLDVDDIKTQLVLLDYSINSFIARPPNCLASLFF